MPFLLFVLPWQIIVLSLLPALYVALDARRRPHGGYWAPIFATLLFAPTGWLLYMAVRPIAEGGTRVDRSRWTGWRGVGIWGCAVLAVLEAVAIRGAYRLLTQPTQSAGESWIIALWVGPVALYAVAGTIITGVVAAAALVTHSRRHPTT